MDEHNLFRFSTLTVDLGLDLLICGEKVMSLDLQIQLISCLSHNPLKLVVLLTTQHFQKYINRLYVP